jgi:hypothetical protein
MSPGHGRRRKLSLDGSVPGADYNRYVVGASPASVQIHDPYGPVSSSAPSEYDPTVAAYDLTGPDYKLPGHWFDGMTQPPPMPVSEARFSDHLSTDEPPPPRITYKHTVMMAELFNWVQEALSAIEPEFEPGGLEQLLGAAPQASSLEMLADDPVAAMTDPAESFDQAMQAPFEAMQAMYDQQQVFEDHAQQIPEQFDPMQQAQEIFDEQMEQLQEQFMMPGFGPGP